MASAKQTWPAGSGGVRQADPCMEPPLLASILQGLTGVALGYLSP
jgi:hypothetical protein